MKQQFFKNCRDAFVWLVVVGSITLALVLAYAVMQAPTAQAQNYQVTTLLATGPPALYSNTSSNSALSGRIALTAGSATYTTTVTYTTVPNCFAGDVTAPGTSAYVVETISGSNALLTFTGTGTHTLKYFCGGGTQ